MSLFAFFLYIARGYRFPLTKKSSAYLPLFWYNLSRRLAPTFLPTKLLGLIHPTLHDEALRGSICICLCCDLLNPDASSPEAQRSSIGPFPLSSLLAFVRSEDYPSLFFFLLSPPGRHSLLICPYGQWLS